MTERMHNDPEISAAQRRQIAGRVLAAIGIGQAQRYLRLIRAELPFQRTPYRWEMTAPYAAKGLTIEAHAWFSYEVSTIGSQRPVERYRAMFLHTLDDKEVTDRTRETFTIAGNRTEYQRSVEVYDPFTRNYEAANFDVMLAGPEQRNQKPPITELAYAEFTRNYELIESGDLTRLK